MKLVKLYTLDEKRFNDHMVNLDRDLKYLEVSLQGGKKFLVGDKLTMADLMVASLLYLTFKHIVDVEMRKELPNLVAYMQAFAAVPAHKKYYGELELSETRITAQS